MNNPNECVCMENDVVWMLQDKDYRPVYGINGKRGTINVMLPPGVPIGLFVSYCPYCGRKFKELKEDK